MPIPLALWAAAGIGAAGMKLYMNLNSPETVVRNATERYNEERYKFYKQMERLVPLIGIGPFEVIYVVQVYRDV